MSEEISLKGYKETTKTRILNESLAQNIASLIPLRLQSHIDWNLKYSLEQDGASLRTLYEKTKPHVANERHGYVLAIKDAKGAVFGAYTNEHLHISDGTRYYGNGDCFLWKTTHLDDQVRFEAFPYSGVNDFVIFCTSKYLSLGGGDGHYGLWVDDDLNFGQSHQTLTFGNKPLGSAINFEVVALEAWEI